MTGPSIAGLQQTTDYRVVLPFYIYAALGFLAGTVLLLTSTHTMGGHYFNPHALAITHTMALAWGTMVIFGASHQLLPVLIEGRLDSNRLAYLTLVSSGIGIPLLIYGFYTFHMGWPLQVGGLLVNIGVISYLANVLGSSFQPKKRRNVHAWYVIAATMWLLATTFFGWILALNFTTAILPANSVEYLSLHAHLGIIGWFLLMIIGVGSRLIPMFMISKYSNNRLLWWVFALLHAALISFSIVFFTALPTTAYYIAIFLGLGGLLLFGRYCHQAYRIRIRKKVDQQMKTSLISIFQMLTPILALIVLLTVLPGGQNARVVMIYGFCIFFGWITAIILGMTFKTMPFIIWNKVYKNRAQGRTPAPKELFNERVYTYMLYAYLSGFILFILGMIILNTWILNIGAISLLLAAILYVYNVILTATHQSNPHDS